MQIIILEARKVKMVYRRTGGEETKRISGRDEGVKEEFMKN